MDETLSAIELPGFARIEEYSAPWCIEANTFATVWREAQRMNLIAHIHEQQKSPVKLANQAVSMEPGRGGKNVARIPVRGLMMKGQSSLGGTSTVQLRRDIRNASTDPNVSGILLDIFSGGGSAIGQADLVAEVRRAARSKPVWSQIEDFGASAAYYLAAASDQVFVNNNDARVGSIGTMIVIEDSTKQAADQGRVFHVFTTGPLKGAGMEGVPVTEEHRADFQATVDQLQVGFDATVKNGRGLTASELAAVRTGGMFFAQRAKELKLIDGVRSIDATLAALSAAA